ncbi:MULTISPECIES: transposase [unclassified Streptomyces]|uniref:transposase n=1 Tax=Streptomyces sp. NPDC055082 TaxID=3365718 RepID=UPI0037D7C735
MEEVVLRLDELLFPSIADVAVLSVDVKEEAVRIDARSTVAGVICPGCGNWSRRIHSSYLRFPVDLLPDREASSLAAWLAKRPEVEVVSRDRAPFFAEGATAGAPQAVQVADWWHLWHNLSEAAERCVADHRGCLQVLAPDPAQPAAPSWRSSKIPPARPGRGDTASLTAPA